MGLNMKLTCFAAAAAFAALPMMASAITVPELDNITDGGVTSVSQGSFHSFEYVEDDATGGARSFVYEFNASEQIGSVTGVSLNPIPSNGITGLYVEWLDAIGGNVLTSWDGTSAVFTTGFAAGETKYLSIGWDASRMGGDVDVNIQAVPVPAGALLLGTALIGGLALRRKA